MPDLREWRVRIAEAASRLEGRIRRTALLHSESLSVLAGVSVWLKSENRQITGSFKLRGASNAVALLGAGEKARGLVTASSGNHGLALAHAAAAAGVACTVFVSRLVPGNKCDGLRTLGADLRVGGESQDEAEAAARSFAGSGGPRFVPPFDDPAVIAGQGTIGLEILADLPEVETILLPLSGGGLAAGVAAAVKAVRPAVRVIGASMAAGAAMHVSLAAGHPVEVVEVPTLADALAGGIGQANRYTFDLVRALLDDVVLLSEPEIAAAIRAAAAEGETVEGGGAVGLGALLAGKVRARGPVVAVLSGGNIDPALHRRILAGADTLAGGVNPSPL